MHEMQVGAGDTATLYCIVFVLLVQFSILNLFIAVILSAFQVRLSVRCN